MRNGILPVILCILPVSACGGRAVMDGDPDSITAREEHDANTVKVQHILIAFKDAPGMGHVTRTKAEAEGLVKELYERAVGGEDFGKLVEEFTNDSSPGVYTMTKATRGDKVPSFGDVAWRLDVGEIGVAPYDETKSPSGWHIIKRLE